MWGGMTKCYVRSAGRGWWLQEGGRKWSMLTTPALIKWTLIQGFIFWFLDCNSLTGLLQLSTLAEIPDWALGFCARRQHHCLPSRNPPKTWCILIISVKEIGFHGASRISNMWSKKKNSSFLRPFSGWANISSPEFSSFQGPYFPLSLDLSGATLVYKKISWPSNVREHMSLVQ